VQPGNAVEVLARYRGLLVSAKRRYPWLDAAELEAVWEDTVLAAVQSYRAGAASERTWVTRKLRWALQHLRQRQHREQQRFVTGALGTDPQIVNGVSPERATLGALAMQTLLRVEPRRQTIVVACLHGFTYSEVAAQHGISISRVHQLYFETIAFLRQELGDGAAGGKRS